MESYAIAEGPRRRACPETAEGTCCEEAGGRAKHQRYRTEFKAQNHRCHPESATSRSPKIRSDLADEGPMQLCRCKQRPRRHPNRSRTSGGGAIPRAPDTGSTRNRVPIIPNRAESAVRNLLLRRDGPRAGWNQESFPYRRLERFFGGSQLPPQRLWQTPRQRLPWNLRAKERCTRRSTGAAATARESPLPAASHFQSPLPRPPARAPAPSKIAGRLRLRNMDHPLRHAPIIFPSQNRRCHPESAKQRTPTIRSALADEGPMQLCRCKQRPRRHPDRSRPSWVGRDLARIATPLKTPITNRPKGIRGL